MTKKEARQQVKEWMKKLDKNYIEKADQSIFEQVKELKIKEDTTLIVVPDARKAMAQIACNYYDNPSRKFQLI